MNPKPSSVSKRRPSTFPGRGRPRRESTLARLVALGPDGEPWISRGGEGVEPRRARTTVVLGPATIGRDVLVCYADEDRVPVVIGVLLAPGDRLGEAMAPSVDLLIDRQRIVLSAQQEVVLQCGKASVTLTTDGKIMVKGVDVVSTAGRVNRIRGGAVKIN